MGHFVSTDVNTDLIINKMSRLVYDKMGQYSQLDDNQLYLVDDEVLDAYGKRISNVEYPQLSNDVATKAYVDTEVSAAAIIHSMSELTSMQLDDNMKERIGVATGFRYKLVNGNLEHGVIQVPNTEGTLVDKECDYIHVEDFAVTTITLSTMNDVVVFFPPPPDDRCRDFILKIKVLTETSPSIQFVPSAGASGDLESIDFESDDDSWAEIEPGVNFMLFTETERT